MRAVATCCVRREPPQAARLSLPPKRLWAGQRGRPQRVERQTRKVDPSGVRDGLVGRPGGAEFRLPLLIGASRFIAIQAVILSKAIALFVVPCRSVCDGSVFRERVRILVPST